MSDERIDPLLNDPGNEPMPGAGVSDEQLQREFDAASAVPQRAQQQTEQALPTEQQPVQPQQQALPLTPQAPPPQAYQLAGPTQLITFTGVGGGQPAQRPSISQKVDARTPHYELAGAPQPIGGDFAGPSPSWTSDFGNELKIGGVGLAHDVVNFAQWGLGQLGAQGASDYLKTQRDQLGQTLERAVNELSPEDRRAMGSSAFGITALGGQVDPATGRVPSPSDVGWGSYLRTTITTQIPAALLFFVPGSILGKAATMVAKGIGVGEKAATVAGRLPFVGDAAGTAAAEAASAAAARAAAVAPLGTAARVGTTVGLGGAVQAGSALELLEQELKNMSQATADANPAYRAFRAQGMNDSQAREAMFKGFSGGLAAAQFGIGGVTAGILGEIFRMPLGRGRTTVGGRLGLEPTTRTGQAALGAAEGGLAMGGQVGGGLATQQALDPTRTQGVDWGQVAQATGAGALGGALMGGAVGGVVGGRPRPAEIAKPSPTTGLDPAVEMTARIQQGQTQALPTGRRIGDTPPWEPPRQPLPPGPETPGFSPAPNPPRTPFQTPPAVRPPEGPQPLPSPVPWGRPPWGGPVPERTLGMGFPTSPDARAPFETPPVQRTGEAQPFPAPRMQPAAPVEQATPTARGTGFTMAPGSEPGQALNLGVTRQEFRPTGRTLGDAAPWNRPAPEPTRAPLQTPPTQRAGEPQPFPAQRLQPIPTAAPAAPVNPLRRAAPWDTRTAPGDFGRLEVPPVTSGEAPTPRFPKPIPPTVATLPDGRVDLAGMPDAAVRTFAKAQGIPLEMADKAPIEALREAMDRGLHADKGPDRQELLDKLIDAGKRIEDIKDLSRPTLEKMVKELPLASEEKAVAPKAAKVKAKVEEAKAAPAVEPEATKRPSGGKTVDQLKKELKKDFGEPASWVNTQRRPALAERYDELATAAAKETAEQEAFYKEKGITMPEPKVQPKASEEPVKPTPATVPTREGTQGVASESQASLPAGEDAAPLVALKTTTPTHTAEEVAASVSKLRKRGTPEAERKAETAVDEDKYKTTDEILTEDVPTEGPAEPSLQVEEEGARAGVRRQDLTSWQDLGEASFKEKLTPNMDNVTNRKKAGRTLENFVRYNNMSPEAADFMWRNRFGESPKAAIKSFGQYLDERIAYLGDDQNFLNHAARRDQATDPAKVKAFNLESAAFDPEHVEYLRKMREALSGDEAAVREFEDLQANRSRVGSVIRTKDTNVTLDLVDEMRKRGLNAPPSMRAMDPRANAPVTGLNASTNGVNPRRPPKAQAFMARIANDPWIRQNLPEVARLADRYRKLVPDHVLVMTPGEFRSRFPDRPQIAPNTPGRYDPVHDVIILNDNPLWGHESRALEVMMHETNHAVTAPYFERPRLSQRAIDILNVIRDEFRIARDGLSGDDLRTFDYALSSIDEFHTHLMTSPVLERVARALPPSDRFKTRMAEYGYRPSELRNMWNAFVGWVRRVVGLSPREVSDTLFDRITKPISDILEYAGQSEVGNRRTGPTPHPFLDKLYRGGKIPTQFEQAYRDAVRPQLGFLNSAGRTLREQAERTRFTDETARATALTTIRPMLLQAMTPDAMIDRYGPSHFTTGSGENLLAMERAAENKINSFSDGFKDTYIPKARALIDKMWGRQEVQNLLVEGTMAKARLGTNDPVANAHLTTEAEIGQLQHLQRRYAAMSADEQAIYREARDLFKEIHAKERQVQLEGLVNGVFGDKEITHGQREALIEALKTKRGIEAVIQDRSNVGQIFGEAWTRWQPLARAVANFHNQGFVEGDYFPLRRHGDYVVTYGDRSPESTVPYGVEMFDTLRDAQRRQTELMADNLNPSDIEIKSQKHARAMVDFSSGFLRQLNDEIDRKFVGEYRNTMKDLVANQALQFMAHGEAARLAISQRRNYIEGASKDAIRTIAGDVNAAAYRMGYAAHAPELAAVRGRIDRHIAEMKGRTNPVTRAEVAPSLRSLEAKQIRHEHELRRPNSDEPSNTGVALAAGRITQGTFVHSLLSFSQAIVNSLEAHILGASLIGGRHGFARSAVGLTKAMTDMLPTAMSKIGTGTAQSVRALFGMGPELQRADWQMANVFRDRLVSKGANANNMGELFKALTESGVLNHSLASDLRDLVNPTRINQSAGGRAIQRFLDASAVMGHVAEETNKSAIAKVAFDLEMRRTNNDVGKSVEYAVNQVRRAVPNWSNKARLATAQGFFGKLGPAVMQFRNYGLHMYSLLPLLVTEARRQMRAEGKSFIGTDSGKALAMMIGSWGVAAGAFGFMSDATRLASGLYDVATGAVHPHDSHREIDRVVASIFGPQLGEIISRGPLYSLAGIDVTRRVGVMNPLNLPDLASYRTGDIFAAVGKLAGGASTSMFTDMFEAYRKGINGDLVGAVGGMMPRNIRDVVQAEELARRGVVDPKGRVLLPASQIGAGAVFAKGLGIQPSQISRFREGRAAELELRTETADARSEALNAFVESRQGGGGLWSDAYRAVQRFNRDNPRTPITSTQLQQALRDANAAVAAPYGLRVARNQVAAMREATSHIPR